MTRPNIVRADTLDLQDQDNPTAAEHQKPLTNGGLAPHQRAEVHHVLEERSSEEHALADAWNMAGGEITQEPGIIDHAQDEHSEQDHDHDQDHTTNGNGDEGEENGESEDDDMMDRISSSPSIDDEDIDFEFVYALHTFVATVEGQANATKGDTMVLLDDSNSYWWLVRVVKDSSIGYLPAEHIETPTERLARLNKHRNIDLSATMLSDNSEKTRNPLKKAMRRRNAKTVQFAAPTYVEASDYDYSTDDEDQPMIDPYAGIVQSEEAQQNGAETAEEPAAEKAVVHEEPSRASSSSSRASFDREQAATAAAALAGTGSGDEPQLSPKLVDKTEAAPLKSRRTRNTDSFLKDDTIETRKITLTPGLLREEGKDSMSTDSTRNPSLENLVKQVSPPEPLSKKDSKREKEKKKGGMLSGLFKSKKKDKKGKDDVVVVAAADLSDAEKVSYELQRSSPVASPSQSGRASPVTTTAGLLSPTDTRRQEVQARQPTRGKLQKQPPSQSPSPSRDVPVQEPTTQQPQEEPREFVAELQGSEAAVEMAAAEPEHAAAEDQTHLHTELALQDKQQKDNALSPLTNTLKRDDSKPQKPTKAKKSKERMLLDDFDAPADDEGPNPFKEQEERAAAAAEGNGSSESLSESPVEISHSTFMHGTEIIHVPVPGADDGLPSDDEDDEEEEPESLTSSPSIIEHPSEPVSDVSDNQQDDDPTPTAPRSPAVDEEQQAATEVQKASTTPPPNRGLSTDSVNTASTTTTTSSSAPTNSSPITTPASRQPWSDNSLRAWLEDGSEVRDMMVIIHDTSDVTPAKEDHPLMRGLFVEERKGVSDMMGQLDGLLAGLMERRGVVV